MVTIFNILASRLMRCAVSESANVLTNEMVADNSCLKPVQPSATGKGLPFAPVDWPNPGDVWTWKVGNKVNPSGYYLHRFLIVPERLQKTPSRKIWLGSKTSVVRYLQSEFPEVDAEAFFSLFTWDIPAEVKPTSKAKDKVSAKKAKVSNRAKPENHTPKRTRNSEKKLIHVVDSDNDENHTPKTKRTRNSAKKLADNENDETFEPILAVYPEQNAVKDSTSLADQLAQMTAQEFETYLNSLDDILPSPSPSPSVPQSNPVSASRSQMKDFTKARKELTSFLASDFSRLLSSNKHQRVTELASMLESDPNLTSGELCMLNLIQEIASARTRFLEAKQVKDEAKKFFVELEGNIVHMRKLKSEYVITKDKMTLLRSEGASASSTIQEIDEEIAVLQTRRAALAEVVKKNQKKIAGLATTESRLHDSVLKMADEVHNAISERPSWEAKKKEADEQEAEILDKFASIQGFSFVR